MIGESNEDVSGGATNADSDASNNHVVAKVNTDVPPEIPDKKSTEVLLVELHLTPFTNFHLIVISDDVQGDDMFMHHAAVRLKQYTAAVYWNGNCHLIFLCRWRCAVLKYSDNYHYHRNDDIAVTWKTIL